MYEWLWRAVSLITLVLQTLDSITSGVCVKDREASHVQYLAGGAHIAGRAQYFVHCSLLSSSAFTFLQSGYYISSSALSAGSREDN